MWHCLRFRCGNTDGTHRLRANSQNTVHGDRRRQRGPSAHIHRHCARWGHQHQRSQSSIRSGTYSQDSQALLTRLKSTRETYSFQWKCLYTGYASFWNFANFSCSNFTFMLAYCKGVIWFIIIIISFSPVMISRLMRTVHQARLSVRWRPRTETPATVASTRSVTSASCATGWLETQGSRSIPIL